MRHNGVDGLLLDGLNESPSEKEGKCALTALNAPVKTASMKAPPKRKGNFACPFERVVLVAVPQ